MALAGALVDWLDDFLTSEHPHSTIGLAIVVGRWRRQARARSARECRCSSNDGRDFSFRAASVAAKENPPLP